MKVNTNIFKSRDIRGVYPEELNEETAYNIGRAFACYTGAKNIVVGRDMRISSPVLFESLIKGLAVQGVKVYNIGLIPTECIYFAVGHYGYGAGIMATASHNPKEYNGFKMIKKRGDIIEMVRGKDLIPIIKKGEFQEVKEIGEVEEIDIWQDFLNHIFSFIDVKKIKPFKVVVDAGNGMAGKTIPQIAPNLPIKIIPLNFELDGNFPAHLSNPLEKGATGEIIKTIKNEKADFGFIFDGDADRIFLIDELGNFIKGDITLLLLAKYFLKKNPGKSISYNLICSKAVPELIKKWGGKPVRTAVGVVEVRDGIIKNDGIMGGELSGHYIFRDNFYFDSGFIAFLVLLELISESEKEVSKMAKELEIYAKSVEINFKVKNKEEIIDKIKEKYSNGKQDFLDGVTIEYDDWWFNIRPSNTEPLLRLTIEADSQKLLEKKKKELTKFILFYI